MPFLLKNRCWLLLFAGLISCKARDAAVPEIKFKKDTFYFGEIKRGDSVNAIFPFSNTSSALLIIKKVGSSCGCTNAFSSKDSLKLNEEAIVQATYHSGKDSGNILKTIIVETNSKPVLHVLYIKGKVNP